MKKRYILACSGLLATQVAHAQSSVTLYGILDAGFQYTNNVANGGSLIRQTSGNLNGSRFGFRGNEDLGGGLSAQFVLEGGFGLNNGKSAQDGRLFGRQAWVGLNSDKYGRISLGRQYDAFTDTLIPLSATSLDFADTAFAHPFDNDDMIHSFRLSNTAKYVSPVYHGLKLEAQYAFSNSTDFAVNRAYSVGLAYSGGPLSAGIAYFQLNGTQNTTINSPGTVDINESQANNTAGFVLGADVQRVAGAGVNYDFGKAKVGFVYTHTQFEGSTSFGSQGGTVRFDNFELNGRYYVLPQLAIGAEYVFTDGHVNKTATFGSSPKWNQIGLQTVYYLSKRTDLYVEGVYQHVSGRGFTAFVYNSGGASSTSNQVVGIAGMRVHF
ncbi:porin [Paraburkholderia solisilvae]|uniref:Outer membrane porin protein n=1 Tax=Paraburkholderia solisilvae TaxID=624376 RepID=A0A6J5DF94_9BURK|nr:porin [Paraburkholderia solisilvae]CAB3751536.1 Outer membrane porin protein [Paraburkholderia solisilvae]